MSRISSSIALAVAVALAALPIALTDAAYAVPAEMAQASADGDITWSVEPAPTADGVRRAFEYSVDPGTQIVDSILITNSGSTAAEFLIYGTDAINEQDTGAFSLLKRDEKPTDVGSWITTDTDNITIEPGMQATVPFNLLVPSDATPGEHVAGIVAAVVTKGNSDGAAVELEQRVGARVYLTVSGALDAAVEVEGLGAGFNPQLNPFAAGDLDLAYTVHNTGNVRVDVAQSIVVTGPFGIELARFTPDTITELLPRQTVRVEVNIPSVFGLLAAWSSVTVTPGPVGSAALASEAEPAAADDPATPAPADPSATPAADGSEAFVDESSVEYLPAEAQTVSIAVSITLTLLILGVIALVYVIARYVAGTRERMYLAIDEATELARAKAEAETREKSGASR